MHLKESDFMEITTAAGRVLMKPKKLVDAGTLTPEEAKKVRYGLKQVKEGKTRPWGDVKREQGL
jgi:hypothetical protein